MASDLRAGKCVTVGSPSNRNWDLLLILGPIIKRDQANKYDYIIRSKAESIVIPRHYLLPLVQKGKKANRLPTSYDGILPRLIDASLMYLQGYVFVIWKKQQKTHKIKKDSFMSIFTLLYSVLDHRFCYACTSSSFCLRQALHSMYFKHAPLKENSYLFKHTIHSAQHAAS